MRYVKSNKAIGVEAREYVRVHEADEGFRNALDFSPFHAIGLFIAILIFFIPATFATTGGCKCGSFPFVPPDTQQLFPNRMFGGETILYVRFEEQLISNAALCEIPAVVPV